MIPSIIWQSNSRHHWKLRLGSQDSISSELQEILVKFPEGKITYVFSLKNMTTIPPTTIKNTWILRIKQIKIKKTRINKWKTKTYHHPLRPPWLCGLKVASQPHGSGFGSTVWHFRHVSFFFYSITIIFCWCNLSFGRCFGNSSRTSHWSDSSWLS